MKDYRNVGGPAIQERGGLRSDTIDSLPAGRYVFFSVDRRQAVSFFIQVVCPVVIVVVVNIKEAS